MTITVADLTCPICSKIISSKNNLSKHMLIHTDQRDFECNICLKRFRLKHHMLRHKKYVHHDDKLLNLTG